MFIFRWIVSNYGESDENLSNFDQVILPANITPNKWHHLVITLVLPQNLGKPHTAKVNFVLSKYVYSCLAKVCKDVGKPILTGAWYVTE